MKSVAPHSRMILAGNPNVGKSTIFNRLCNNQQKTANYAGVTVASHTGIFSINGEKIEIIDLPGAYSLYPNSEDETLFVQYLTQEKENYCGVVCILEALSIRRGLLLLRQIQDLGIPVFVVLNQIDQSERRGIDINIELLQHHLQCELVTTNAKNNKGIEELKEAISKRKFSVAESTFFKIPKEHETTIKNIEQQSGILNDYQIWHQLAMENFGLHSTLKLTQNNLLPKRLQTQETIRRYQEIDGIIEQIITKKKTYRELLTEKLDKILVHPVLGYVVFLAILLFIFQMVFYLAAFPMDWIDSATIWLSAFTKNNLPEGAINSLISNGIVPGIGGIVIFAPQIGILLYFLYLLEDSGYMARAVFLMDRLLRPFGLNGKSIIPLVSGTACAIPAIMSTRNIENAKERLITIMVTPFMTCSARLPVYSIIIGLIIPAETFGGISYKAIALLAMYLLGFVTALLASLILKKIIKTTGNTYLVMDMPAYKLPLFRYDFKLMLEKVWGFITGAGKIIFFVSIIIWFLGYFGPAKSTSKDAFSADVELQNSFLAKMGKSIEPVISPLGFDWKMGVGIITSFAAREVFVGTMSTLYRLDDDAPEEKVIEKMRRDTDIFGNKIFNFATGLSVMMFYAFAMQCISTIAVVLRETKSRKWVVLQIVGMTGLAYFSSLLVYQIFKNFI